MSGSCPPLVLALELCGWALCSPSDFLLGFYLEKRLATLTGRAPELWAGLCGAVLLLSSGCVVSVSCLLVALTNPGLCGRSCPPLLVQFVRALCPHLVFLSSSCPPFIFLVVAPMNSVSGLCGLWPGFVSGSMLFGVYAGVFLEKMKSICIAHLHILCEGLQILLYLSLQGYRFPNNQNRFLANTNIHPKKHNCTQLRKPHKS